MQMLLWMNSVDYLVSLATFGIFKTADLPPTVDLMGLYHDGAPAPIAAYMALNGAGLAPAGWVL